VQTPGEYGPRHIANAINIDIEGISSDIQVASLAQDSSYLMYCRSGYRSGAATEKMTALGFRNADNLDGGVIEWQASGGAPRVTS